MINITRITGYNRTLNNEELVNPDPDMLGIAPAIDTAPINLDNHGYVVFNDLAKGIAVYDSAFVKFLIQNATIEDWNKYLAAKAFTKLTK